jgi:hypothetical protein
MRRLFLGTFLVAALLTKTDPESAHEYSRLGTVDSLVERGTYQLDDSIFSTTIDKIYRDGHYYSHQPPLLATLEAPVYWVIRQPGLRFNNRGRRVSTYLFTLFTNGLALALTVVVFAQILALAGMAARRRDLCAFLLPLGTWLLPYGVVPNSHGISGMLLALLILLLLLLEWRGVTRARLAGIGAVLGLLVAIELLPIVSFVPLTILYLARRRDLRVREWLPFAAAFSLPLLLHAIINIRITGDVIPAGFHHELFRYPGSAFTDDSLTGTIKYDSAGDAARYAWQSMLVGKGFLTFAPVLALALIAGVVHRRWWSRARGVQVILLGGIALSLGVSLLTTNNFGGEAVGFRHGAYLAPAFLTLLMPWLVAGEPEARPRRDAVIAVAIISTTLMLLFAVRKPWSVLTLTSRPVGTWDQYVPIGARIVNGDLFKP